MRWISDVHLSDCSWSHLNLVLPQRLDTLCSHPVFGVSPGCWHSSLVPHGTKSKCSREVTSFALSFCCYLWKGSWETWVPRWSWDQRESPEQRNLPLVNKDQVREHWNKLEIPKSMWPNGMHPWLLREMAGALWVHSWSSVKVYGDSRKFLRARESKCHGHLKEQEDPVNYRLVRFPLFPWKVMQQVILRTIFKHMKDKKENVKTECELTKVKSWQNNLKVFCNETTASVDKREEKTPFILTLARLSSLSSLISSQVYWWSRS